MRVTATKETTFLTDMVKAGGCGSKLGPEELREVLRDLPSRASPQVLFGLGSGDDAGVYQLTPELAIVQTVDFFTPIVDDPYDFGAIAAANAISDCYALGARPICALNIVGFPRDANDSLLKAILLGGLEKAAEAGLSILGGHSVADTEPKYGLAVTGVVHPKQMILNTGARPGDVLVLTKKIGAGIVTGAMKRHRNATSPLTFDKPSQQLSDEVIRSMKTLNKAACETMVEFGASACTDVTGFGLLGHARNLAEASKVSLNIYYSQIPKFYGIEAMAIQCTKGGGDRNLQWVIEKISLASEITEEQRGVLIDPQTSGPLLIAIAKEKSSAFVEALRAAGVAAAAVIGEVQAGAAGTIRVEP